MILENKHKNRRVRMVSKLICYLELSFSDLCLRRYLLSIVKLNCLGSTCVSMISVSFVSHCYGYSRSLVRFIKTCGPSDECCTSRICDSWCKSWDKLHLIQCGLVCENDCLVSHPSSISSIHSSARLPFTRRVLHTVTCVVMKSCGLTGQWSPKEKQSFFCVFKTEKILRKIKKR